MKPSEARAEFRRCGRTIRDWARENAFSPALVYAALSGRVLGERGRAHDIAVALKLKPDPSSIASGSPAIKERDMT